MITIAPKVGAVIFDRTVLDRLDALSRVEIVFLTEEKLVLVAKSLPFKRKYKLRLTGSKKNTFYDMNLTEFLMTNYTIQSNDFFIKFESYEIFEIGDMQVAAITLAN